MIELIILLLGALRATLRSRADVVAENLLSGGKIMGCVTAPIILPPDT